MSRVVAVWIRPAIAIGFAFVRLEIDRFVLHPLPQPGEHHIDDGAVLAVPADRDRLSGTLGTSAGSRPR